MLGQRAVTSDKYRETLNVMHCHVQSAHQPEMLSQSKKKDMYAHITTIQIHDHLTISQL